MRKIQNSIQALARSVNQRSASVDHSTLILRVSALVQAEDQHAVLIGI
jgi:hypothetical protein